MNVDRKLKIHYNYSEFLMNTLKIYKVKPDHFKALLEVSACYIEFEGKILFLQRGRGKPEEKMWGVPAGKIETGETALGGMKRELFEEAGLVLSKIEELEPLLFKSPKSPIFITCFERAFHLAGLPTMKFKMSL